MGCDGESVFDVQLIMDGVDKPQTGTATKPQQYHTLLPFPRQRTHNAAQTAALSRPYTAKLEWPHADKIAPNEEVPPAALHRPRLLSAQTQRTETACEN